MTKIVSVLALMLSVMGMNEANAALIKGLEFNDGGVLPSTESDIVFFTNSGSLETSLFSVTGGLLQQRTIGVDGNSSYLFPNVGVTGGGLDSSLSTVLEFRVKVIHVSTTSPELGGIRTSVFDGVNRYGATFDSSGINILNTWGCRKLCL